MTFSTNQPSFKRATADYSFVGDTFALGLVQAEQKEDQSARTLEHTYKQTKSKPIP